MTSSIRLGGFKILKEVLWVPMAGSRAEGHFPARITMRLRNEKKNLPFLTCGSEGGLWGLNLVVDSLHREGVCQLMQEQGGSGDPTVSPCAILSLFPHRGNLEVTAILLEVLAQERITPLAMANSHSSISVVLSEDDLEPTAAALFGPFDFGAYRTPSDWKLAQKGKEELYREVVASYQEKRPKVYGLEWQGGQDLLAVTLVHQALVQVGGVLKELSRHGLVLTFLITTPDSPKTAAGLWVCMPSREQGVPEDILQALSPEVILQRHPSVVTFAMNGPHFGDRYGIASELFTAFEGAGIDLLGLSCSVASVIGVVREKDISSAIEAIKERFEVPSVTEKG